MALSGTGTLADPYIINNYANLMELVNGSGTYWSPYTNVYARLNADINAETITPWRMTADDLYVLEFYLHFDLGGHSITNLHVGDPALDDSYRPFHAAELYNGTISFYTTAARLYSVISDVTIMHDVTINGEFEFKYSGQTQGWYSAVKVSDDMHNCNINLTVQYPNYTGEGYSDYYAVKSPLIMRYCDINVTASRNHIYRTVEDSGGVIHYFGRTGIVGSDRWAVNKQMHKCRIRGILTNSDVTLGGFLTDGFMLDVNTCVYCFDVRGCTIPQEMVATAEPIVHSTDGTVSTCVINKSYLTGAGLHGGVNLTNTIPCSTREIVNGSALRNKGFPVTNLNI